MPRKTEKPLSSAERMKRYRAKLKKDPSRRSEILKTDRERKRVLRLEPSPTLTEEQITYKREKKRDIMRRYRYRKKLKLWESKESQNSLSVAAIKREKMRKDKIRKRSQVMKRKQKKKEAVKRTQDWRLRIKLKVNDNPNITEESAYGKPKPSTWWRNYRMKRRIKDQLPESPSKKASFVEDLINSPRTEKILKRKGILLDKQTRKQINMASAVMDSFKSRIKELKRNGTHPREVSVAKSNLAQVACKIALKYRCRSKLKRLLGARGKANTKEWWTTKKRKCRKDAVSTETKEKVKNFFLSADISRENPGKRNVIQVDGEKTQKYTMTMTMIEAFRTFKEQNPEIKLGFTLFRACKPIQVCRVSETSRRTCLCTQCCNIALKAEGIIKLIRKINKDDYKNLPTNKDKFQRLTLCPYTDIPRNECLIRQCQNCSTSGLTTEFKTLVENEGEVEISWAKWEYIKIDKGESAKKRVISCVPKQTSMDVYLHDLESDMQNYPAHIFRAKWQHDQMQLCLSSFTLNEAMLVMDYSENYSCHYKDEVASAFFEQIQITIHPMMIYYKQMENSKMVLTKHALIAISDDPKHDAYGVNKFEEAAFEILCQKIENLDVIHQFTDGCAAQYKAKTAFALISTRGKNGSPNIMRNYFETSHGKSVCDGLGAIVKHSAHQAVVTGRRIISSARDMYNHCVTTLKHPKKYVSETECRIRDFVFVEASDVPRDIPEIHVETLKGTRKLHAVRSVGGIHHVETRNLSCYCESCAMDKDDCKNKNYVSAWQSQVLHSQTYDTSRQNDRLETPFQDDVSRKFGSGDFVAIQLSSNLRKSTAAHVYIAQILEISQGEEKAHVKFMRKQRKLYKWPEKEDVSWQPIENIVCTVNAPEAENKRLKFRFRQSELETVEHLVQAKNKTVQFK